MALHSKSVIFAILPLLFDFMRGKSSLITEKITSNPSISGSIAVVVTPLISLMVDQKEKFLEKGLWVNFVGEGQDDDRALDAIVNGLVQLVYISPDSLLENKRYRMLKSRNYQEKMVALVVDEAHCVKFWLVPPVMIVCKFQCELFRRGDEFRTAFAKLGNIRCLLPEKVNVLALTATATKETLECVICRLAMYQPIIIGLPPDRPNIKLIVKPYLSIPTLCQQLSDELKEKRSLFPKTVIFCRSLKHCADV